MAVDKQQSFAYLRLWDEVQASNDFPLSVMISLTKRCCLSCPHCYLANKGRSVQELTYEEILLLLDELADCGVLNLSITGGEPGLRDDLFAVIKAASERHFYISLKTSAYPFESTDIDTLWDSGLHKLFVSIYHTDLERHDGFVHRSGAWERATGALRRFAKRGGSCFACCPVMNWNAPIISDLLDLCEREGWNPLVDPKITHRDDGSCEPCSFIASEKALSSVFIDERITTPAPCVHDSTTSICGAAISFAYIESDGLVKVCSSIPWSLGSLREKTFSEIWRNSPDRKRILTIRWADAQKCRNCPYETYCSRCPGESILEHGDPNIPASIDCYVAKARYQHAKKGIEKKVEDSIKARFPAE
ncbi:MAG: radical SAM protein [Deltaproteobacteria bacterium]|nr:radical SAM protein [Deltaproteobacteria bacterium]